MNFRMRLFALIAGLLILTVSLSLWRYANLNSQDQNTQHAKMVEHFAGFARHMVQAATEELRNDLFSQVTREQTGRHLGLSPSTEEDLNRTLTASPFLAVALLRPDAKIKWQPAWVRSRPVLHSPWPEAFLRGVLQDLPLASAPANSLKWYRVSDPVQQPVFVVAGQFREGNETVVAVGFIPASALSRVTQTFLGSDTEMMVVDELGTVMAYTEQAYVGASLAESHPAVAEYLRHKDMVGTFTSKNRLRQSVLAATHQLNGSNLIVMVTRPLITTWALVPRLILGSLILAAALLVLGLGIGHWLLVPMETALTYLTDQLTNIAHGQPVRRSPLKNIYLKPLNESIERLATKDSGEAPQFLQEATATHVESEKLGAYREISVGLAQALRDPLASILGQVQLARAKADQEDLGTHFSIIERETRRARDTMENLLRLSNEEGTRDSLNLDDVILSTLASQHSLLTSHNVNVHKEFNELAPVAAHPGQLQTAFE
jgi:signal transduction histidine kinase